MCGIVVSIMKAVRKHIPDAIFILTLIVLAIVPKRGNWYWLWVGAFVIYVVIWDSTSVVDKHIANM